MPQSGQRLWAAHPEPPSSPEGTNDLSGGIPRKPWQGRGGKWAGSRCQRAAAIATALGRTGKGQQIQVCPSVPTPAARPLWDPQLLSSPATSHIWNPPWSGDATASSFYHLGGFWGNRIGRLHAANSPPVTTVAREGQAGQGGSLP